MLIQYILQARVNSSRFYGKVLKKIKGETILESCIKRTQKSEYCQNLFIVTSNSKLDDDIFNLSKKLKVKCIRGDENNVLSRFKKVQHITKSEYTVRLTSDSPLNDIQTLDACIKKIINNKKIDYVSTILRNNNPIGIHSEVFKSNILFELDENNKIFSEHVTPGIYNQKKYLSMHVSSKLPYPNCRLTLDFPDDFYFLKELSSLTKKKLSSITQDELINILSKNNYLCSINLMHLKNRKIKNV